MAIAASELTWISSLLHDIRFFLESPPVLFCDNLIAIFVKNLVFEALTEHVDIDDHFMREKVLMEP